MTPSGKNFNIAFLASAMLFAGTTFSNACSGSMIDVTSNYAAGTDLHSNVESRWKENCPTLICGAADEKTIKIEQICMQKQGDPAERKFKVTGKMEATASFGWLNPLDDTQVVMAKGIADFNSCTFTLTDELSFRQGSVGTLASFFVSPADGPLDIKDSDRNNECAHYMPEEFRNPS